jgi:membrane associated rhomboid family serine protease
LANATIWTIIAINVTVYGAWKYAEGYKDTRLYRLLTENATLSELNLKAKRYYTLVTCAFSHRDLNHLIFNMFSFYTFSGLLTVLAGVGIGHFGAMIFGSAMASSAAWLWHTKETNASSRRVWSGMRSALGASGVVMGISAVATCMMPFMPMTFMLIPVRIPLCIFTTGYIALDMYYLNESDNVGRSAHLGGFAFGVVYYLAFLRGRMGGGFSIARALR